MSKIKKNVLLAVDKVVEVLLVVSVDIYLIEVFDHIN